MAMDSEELVAPITFGKSAPGPVLLCWLGAGALIFFYWFPPPK